MTTARLRRVCCSGAYRIGYGRAARLIETMEEQGIIGHADGSRPREVLVSSVDEVFDGAARRGQGWAALHLTKPTLPWTKTSRTNNNVNHKRLLYNVNVVE